MVTPAAPVPGEGREMPTGNNTDSEVAKTISSVYTPLGSNHLSPTHRRRLSSGLQSALEQKRKGEKKMAGWITHTPCLSFLMLERDRRQSFTQSKQAPDHWATLVVLCLCVFHLNAPLWASFVSMEFGFVLLCLKAPSQSVLVRDMERKLRV